MVVLKDAKMSGEVSALAPRATMLGQVSGTMRIVMFSGLRLSISNRPIWRSSSSPCT